MTHRLIATDLDNTLLRADKSVSQYSFDIIARVQALGIPVVVASARPLRNILDAIAPMIPHGIIANCGAHTEYGGHVLDQRPIPADVATALSRMLVNEYGVYISVDCYTHSLSNHPYQDSWGYWGLVSTDFNDGTNVPETQKISVEAEDTTDIMGIDYASMGLRFIRNESDYWHMIVREDVGKWTALKALCDRLGVDPADVVAFGDDHADLDMLLRCGTGVATANAVPAVKAIADEVCGRHDEDGVATWLELNILR